MIWSAVTCHRFDLSPESSRDKLRESADRKRKSCVKPQHSKMKRCPACKRVEADDTLTFCRADGTILISDSVQSAPKLAQRGLALRRHRVKQRQASCFRTARPAIQGNVETSEFAKR